MTEQDDAQPACFKVLADMVAGLSADKDIDIVLNRLLAESSQGAAEKGNAPYRGFVRAPYAGRCSKGTSRLLGQGQERRFVDIANGAESEFVWRVSVFKRGLCAISHQDRQECASFK